MIQGSFFRLLPWATPLEGATEVEDGSEKPGFNEELSRCVKATGLGREVGGVTRRLPTILGHRGRCLLTASAVGGFSGPPAVAGKGRHLVGPEQQQ